MMNWFSKTSSSGYYINPKFIYDSFSSTLLKNVSQEQESILNFHFNYIAKEIVSVFSSLLRDQIKKYIERNRIDSNKKDVFENIDSIPLSGLPEIFNKYTFRSDMVRNNERWGLIAQKINELNSASGWRNISNLLTFQNGVLNLIHNTGTSVLDKFSNGSALLLALENCQNGNVKNIVFNSSKEVKEMF